MIARDARARVADQLRELVVESDQMGSRGELGLRVERVVAVERMLAQALGQRKQAREHGMPLGPSVAREREARELRRQAVMALAVACGAWVAAMDYEERRQQAANEVAAAGASRGTVDL